ncbi:MAG TPA: nucleotidyltransferase family protein [Thermoanaerobaculia bacterium]|nr:nucleotidyltransferase family protein [Thermoanaerobaculia bacterium]
MMPPPQVVDRLHVSSGDLAAFCRRWHIAKLEVFGSVVRDDFRAESDVDFLVSFEPGLRPSGFDWFQLKEELSDLVGRKVDLVDRRLVERSRNLYRRQHILSEATPVHGA